MKHWTCLYTHRGSVLAVAGVTELSNGRLNVCVASKAGAKWGWGNWTATAARDQAHRWAEELIGPGAALPSRWAEADVTL